MVFIFFFVCYKQEVHWHLQLFSAEKVQILILVQIEHYISGQEIVSLIEYWRDNYKVYSSKLIVSFMSNRYSKVCE